MGMLPHWFGLQKQAVTKFDTTCENCHRRYEKAMSPDVCPFCDCKPTKRASGFAAGRAKNKGSVKAANR